MSKRNNKYLRLAAFLNSDNATIKQYEKAEEAYIKKHGERCYLRFNLFKVAERYNHLNGSKSKQTRG